MKKFGLKKKTDEDDSSRSKLFGSKSRSANPATPTLNPYRVPPASNPYAVSQGDVRDPYAQPSPSYSGSRNTASSSASQLPSYQQDNQRNARDNRYQGSSASTSGYGNNGGYGGGYGSTNYESPVGGPRPAPGGYGGLGRANSYETTNTDDGRNALFGNAPKRYEEQQQSNPLPPGQGDSYTGDVDQQSYGYGQHPDRELTAEEREEEEIRATKDQIRQLKQQDVSSTRNALRIAQQAEETGRATLERLGQQGERIHRTEENLDAASRENRMAAEKAAELKTLNRSMFAVHVNNPFTSKQRQRDREAKILETHQGDRQTQADTRAAAYASLARQREADRDARGTAAPPVMKRDLAERSKYQFEADSEDEQMEDEIDTNLGHLANATTRLHQVGRAMGEELDKQITHIGRITEKAERVDDGIVINRARLDRIH